jgi:hypothetical protein
MAAPRHISEPEWLASENPYEMLRFSRMIICRHPRKARLFAVACCRRISHLLADTRSRAAVDIAEQYADGTVSEATLRAAAQAAEAAHDAAFHAKGKLGASGEWAAEFAAYLNPFFAASRASNFAYVAAGDGLQPGPEHAAQANLLRCILGNPFRPAQLDRCWLTSNVASLAESIYADQAFDRLPILADALEDAGCDNADILNHCRQPGEHVRGCWVVDLVLGKS